MQVNGGWGDGDSASHPGRVGCCGASSVVPDRCAQSPHGATPCSLHATARFDSQLCDVARVRCLASHLVDCTVGRTSSQTSPGVRLSDRFWRSMKCRLLKGRRPSMKSSRRHSTTRPPFTSRQGHVRKSLSVSIASPRNWSRTSGSGPATCPWIRPRSPNGVLRFPWRRSVVLGGWLTPSHPHRACHWRVSYVIVSQLESSSMSCRSTR
jgi:hypothetical protein